jgi:hypothetical protein
VTKVRVYRYCWFAVGGMLVLYTVSPLLLPMIAFSLAGLCGCELNEGSVHPCYMFGINIGDLLYAMLFWVWLFIFIVPTGLIALATFVGLSIGLWPKLWPEKLSNK